MKICEKCGARYSDDKTFCVDCNEKLGDKLSAAEEQKIQTNLNHKIEEMYNKRDPLYVSKFDKIIGLVSLVGTAITLLLILIRVFTQQNIALLVCAIIFFLISSLEALLPQVMWELEKMRFSLFVNGDTEPSDFYLKFRKITVICSIISATTALVMSFLI